MKLSVFILVFGSVMALSCGKNGRKNQVNGSAVLGETAVADVSSGRYEKNLVEDLYTELKEKHPGLKSLELQMKQLEEGRADSLKAFNVYDEKSTKYYGDARKQLAQIKDSLLRVRLAGIIEASLKNYKDSTARETGLLAMLDKKTLTLQDLFVFLKVIKTMAVMEGYQKENHPSRRPIENYVNRLDTTVIFADSLIGK